MLRKRLITIVIMTLIFFNLSMSVSVLIFEFEESRHKNNEIPRLFSSNTGYLNISNQDLFWFIQVTDTHITGSNSIDALENFFNETYKEINPLFICNTGDLVDSNSGFSQNEAEWIRYKNLLDANSMNSSVYIDLVGNHDVSLTPDYTNFLNYSMLGSSYNTTHFSFNKSLSYGDYAFIGLNTVKNSSYNIIEFGYIGYLSTNELDWYENELEKYKNFDRIFVFGHHPQNRSEYRLISKLSTSGMSFSQLNEKYNIFCYISGHSHDNYIHDDYGVLSIETTTFNHDNGTYRIISIDNNRLSTSVEQVGLWPQGLITYPPTNENGMGVSNSLIPKMRVLAWDPNGVISVKWCAYNLLGIQVMNWKSLIQTDSKNPLWEGDWNLNLNNGQTYTIKVLINGGSGETIREISFTLQNEFKIILLSIVLIILISFLSVTTIIAYYSELKKRR